MRKLRKHMLWNVFKALLCITIVGMLFGVAAAASGFVLAATICGWVATTAFAMFVCILIWVVMDPD
jgi:hypothetical protein